MVLPSIDYALYLRRALVASLALHLLFALLLPVWQPPRDYAAVPYDIHIQVRRLARLQVVHAAARSLPTAAPRTRRRAPVPVAAARHELRSNRISPKARPNPPHAARHHLNAAPGRVAPANVPLVARANPTTAPLGVVAQKGSSAATPSPVATTGPRNQQGNGNAPVGGVMPLGAAQDPVLDPRVLTSLRQSVATHVTLLVTVGDDGRTKSVAFHPPLQPQQERAIEAILAAANWDPAVCGGGIACQGTATINL